MNSTSLLPITCHAFFHFSTPTVFKHAFTRAWLNSVPRLWHSTRVAISSELRFVFRDLKYGKSWTLVTHLTWQPTVTIRCRISWWRWRTNDGIGLTMPTMTRMQHRHSPRRRWCGLCPSSLPFRVCVSLSDSHFLKTFNSPLQHSNLIFHSIITGQFLAQCGQESQRTKPIVERQNSDTSGDNIADCALGREHVCAVHLVRSAVDPYKYRERCGLAGVWTCWYVQIEVETVFRSLSGSHFVFGVGLRIFLSL